MLNLSSAISRLRLAALLLLTVWTTCACADETRPPTQYLQFPLIDHPAYGYLNRLETAERIPLFSNTRPYLGFIRHPWILSDAPESREARRYAAEGAANMRIIGWQTEEQPQSSWVWLKQHLPFGLRRADWLYASGFHLASWAYDGMFSAAIQPVYGLEAIRIDSADKTITRFTGGLRIEGGYARRLHFMVDFRDHTEMGNGPYWSRSQLYEDRWASVDLSGGQSTTYNLSESFLQYSGKDLSLAAGRGRFRWGPGQFGSLFLNSRMPPLDYVRFDAALESKRSDAAVNYTFLHGWLQDTGVVVLYTPPGSRPRIMDRQKYISAQRLELRPRGNLLLAFSQAVIYGERGVQLAYLTPLNFLYSVQHSTEDKDNLVISVDGTWRPVAGLRAYGELFLDDLTVHEVTTSRGTNKTAYTVGTQVRVPRPWWDHFDATLEYTKIRPFVYTHIFPVNAYTHWTSPIGYTTEPNSEFLTGRLQAVFYPARFALEVRHQNHGSNGGNIRVPVPDLAQKQMYPFLSGTLTRQLRLGVHADCQVLPNFTVFASGTRVRAMAVPDRFEIAAGFAWNK